MDRILEVMAVGTSALLVVVVIVLLGTHASGDLQRLPAVGTATATILFAYLWLLVLVVVSQGTVLGDEAQSTRALGTAAGSGSAVATVFGTVILIVGSVADAAPIEPDPVTVAGFVLVAVVAGAIGGFGLAVTIRLCDRMAVWVLEAHDERATDSTVAPDSHAGNDRE